MIKTEYDDLESLLAAFGITLTAAQVHGYLTGKILAGSTDGLNSVLEKSEFELDDMESLTEGLAAVSAEIEVGLAQPEPFDPLLPDDDCSLEERVSALVDWCSSLLSGLGESQIGGLMSPEAQEVVEDMQALAEAEYGGEEESEEVAFTELVEFMRVAISLLFEELVPVGQGEGE